MLRIAFGDVVRGGRVVVERGVIALPGGAVVGLVGLNGAGKTSWMHCIAGIVAEKAQLTIDDRRVETVALMLQHPALPAWLTVREAVQLGLPPTVDVDGLLRAWGLTELSAKHTSALSTGQLQFVAAMITAESNATLRLFDEPFSALDIRRRRELVTRLQRGLPETEFAVVSAQASADLMDTCSHFLVLHEGRLRDIGSRALLAGGADVQDRAAFESALLAHFAGPGTLHA
ncbi:MAG: ATP-binding cassette domain-containing protein [Gemmatimonadaceae bacterium]